MQWASVVARLEDRPDLTREGDDIFRTIVNGDL
jgi:hypothetical protein